MGVRRFVAVLAGPTPATARPVFATDDPAIVTAVVDLIAAKLRGDDLPNSSEVVLRLERPPVEPGPGGEP